ncbi:MAG: hypothetical protein IH818_12290 [Acidobacteria bacterium]|nr:hypothetical protein [Acidobacteriota bacterium]
MYAPQEPGPWPVIIVVHGYGGSRNTLIHLSSTLAAQGAVVFNLEVAMVEPFLPAIEQVSCAVRFARATAATYGGDTSRIILVGGSGGAAASAVVGLAGDDFEGDCLVVEGSSLPDAIVGHEGPYDWAIRAYDPQRFDPTVLAIDNPDLLDAINPYSYIGGNPDLKVRLIHGIDNDDTIFEVLPEVSTQFHEILIDAGYDAELTIIEGGTHFDHTNPYSETFKVIVQQVMNVASD